MEAKYALAVRAGITGGIVAASLSLIIVAVGIFVTDVSWFTIGEFLSLVLLAATMAATGALAVAMARPRDAEDAGSLSSLAGAIAGLMGGAAFTIAVFVLQYFLQYDFLENLGRFEVFAMRGLLSLLCGGISCCLVPLAMVVAVVLALAGGWIAWLLIAKK